MHSDEIQSWTGVPQHVFPSCTACKEQTKKVGQEDQMTDGKPCNVNAGR
jgi:hypothetical protein